MSASAPVGVRSPRVGLVSNQAYYGTLRALVDGATTYCHATLFIVDTNPHHDPEAKVLQLLKALRSATWRGVDVKLLIGGSRTNLAIEEACHIARDVALSEGVDCRLLTSQERRGSHKKIVTLDDFVLGGSHNWSSGAFSGQIQESLLIESRSLAAYMRAAFDVQWTRAAEEVDHVSV